MFEILNHFKESIEKSEILKELELNENQYFLVSAHREENINNPTNFKYLLDSLKYPADKFNSNNCKYPSPNKKAKRYVKIQVSFFN